MTGQRSGKSHCGVPAEGSAAADAATVASVVASLLESIDEHLCTGVWSSDGRFATIWSGPGLERFLGGAGPRGEDPARTWEACVHPDDRALFDAACAARRSGRPSDVEYRLCGLDGRERWIFDRGRPRLLPDGRIALDRIVSDSSERRRLIAELEHRSRTDALTGLYNRRHFNERLEAELARAAREQTTPAVILIDVDRLKAINDAFGHLGGDAVLVELGRRAGSTLRPYDTLARWGGDEYAILIPAPPDDAAVHRVCEAIREAVCGERIQLAGGSVTTSVSVGAARHSPAVATLDALLDAADAALYQAKQAERKPTRINTP
jgi:diguanylate cyclase (GGDEF)-like protein